jgi:hypothetical protein
MMSSKLSKQLQRELKANPQKAGALGLLCLVAAYFWGPLIFKSDAKNPASAAVAPTATTTAATAMPEPISTSTAKPLLDWRTLSSRLESDPSMRSVAGKTETEIARSPFDAPVKVVKEEAFDSDLAELLEEANAAGLFDDTPVITKQMTSTALNAFPLQLTSTLVGPRSRTAIINGKAYSQGMPLGKLNDVELVLEYVSSRTAVIAWNGMKRKLWIPKPGEQEPSPPPDESELTGVKRSKPASETETTGEAAEFLEGLAERSEKTTN